MKKCLSFFLILFFAALNQLTAQNYDNKIITSDINTNQVETFKGKNSVDALQQFGVVNNLGWSDNQGESLTPAEGFEGATFPPTGWDTTIVAGPTTSQQWSRVTNTLTFVGGYGLSQSAAKFNFYGTSSGSIQELSSPVFTPSVAGEVLMFDYASCPYGSFAPDTLIVMTSTDGGSSFTELLKMWTDTNTTGSVPSANWMGTVFKSTSSFTPTDASWACKKLPLPVGTNVVKFRTVSGFGNNLYIDNILTFVPRPALSGTYTINPGGSSTMPNFQSFETFRDSINQRGVSGAVTVNVTAGTYAQRLALCNTVGTTAANTLTINGNTATLSPIGNQNTTDYALLISGVDYVTVTGLNITSGGTFLYNRIERGYLMTPAGPKGITNCTIQNATVNLNDGDTVASASTGVSVLGATMGYPSVAINNVTVQGMTFNSCDRGVGVFNTISTVGTLTNMPNPPFNNFTVNACNFGTGSAIGGNMTTASCINVILSGCTNSTISNNNVDSTFLRNTLSTGGIQGFVMQVSSGNVFNNRIKYLATTNPTSATVMNIGISSGPISGGTVNIFNNTITNMVSAYTGATVQNFQLKGIQVTNFVGGAVPTTTNVLYNNTIVLNSTAPVTFSSSCVWSFPSGLPVYFGNNIFINKISTTALPSRSYCVVDSNLTRLLVGQYNNLYFSGVNGAIAKLGQGLTAFIDTVFSQYKINSGFDTNSVSGNVTFLDQTLLSIDTNAAANWVINGKGLPLPNVNADIRGRARSTTLSGGATDLGAYEVGMVASPPAATEIFTVGSAPIGAGDVTAYTQFGDTLGFISWGAGWTTYPTSVILKRFSGMYPVADGLPKRGNVWDSLTATGSPVAGPGFYSYTAKFGFNHIGTTGSMDTLRLARKVLGSWVVYFDDVPNVPGRKITADSLNVFGQYALTGKDNLVGISNNTGIPLVFALHQNYPNPFNPSTSIQFDLPRDTRVTLRIYDITGRLVATLFNNELKTAGYYSVMFNANSYASGVYFYKIEAGPNVVSKKMVLVK